MAAMLVLVWLSSLMMMMMRSSDAASKIIYAHSGEAVLLSSDLQETDLEAGQDIRWTHPHLVVSSKTNNICHHKRCELLRNGSLRFSRVLPSDSGNYSLQVFSETGIKLQSMTVITLRVEADGSSSSSSSSVAVSVLICCILLLLFIFFILRRRRRRRSQTTKTNTGHMEENVYVVMHGKRGKETKDAEKQEKDEESHYVTQQMSVDEEDIYV